MNPKVNSQSGLGQLEVLLAGFLGLTLLFSAGYLFISQVRGYQSIKEQIAVQSGIKKAMQGMTRQISNAGACLTKPTDNFKPEKNKLTFAFIDLGGHHCNEGTKIIMSFYSNSGQKSDDLVEDIQCVGGNSQTKTLTSVPHGGMNLSFLYFDKKGVATQNPTLIKSIEVSLMLKSASAAHRLQTSRTETIRIDCMNLI